MFIMYGVTAPMKLNITAPSLPPKTFRASPVTELSVSAVKLGNAL
jgi:hypothetical protein